MGLFSSKKKKYVGVSNTRLIPKGENPQALKDSVASYISDYGKNNGNIDGDLVSYTNEGIDKSIVFGIKRLNRWVRKPGKYSTVGEVVGNMDTLTDEDVRDKISEFIQDKYAYPVTFYYLNNLVYDYSHFTKQVLIDRFDYDPTYNTLNLDGQELYLVDAVVHTKDEEIKHTDFLGLSFTAGATPYREWDKTREYTESNVVLDTVAQFEFFEATAVNELTIDTVEKITETTVVTTPPEEEPVEGEPPPEPAEPTSETTQVTNSTEVINNIPIKDLTSQVYVREEDLAETTSETTTEDLEAGTVTTVKEITLTHREFYECTYVFRETFSDYFTSQDIDWELLTEDEVMDLLDEAEEEDIRIQLGYEYTNDEGTTVIVYETLTDEETGFIDSENNVVPFGTFLPNLYFKSNFTYLDNNKQSTIYKQSRQYTKKLNLDYKDLAEQIKKEVDNQDKIMYSYIKHGVNFHSTDEVDMKYLHAFFAKYFKYLDTNNTYDFDFPYEIGKNYVLKGKTLNFKDNILKYSVSVDQVSYARGNESINPIGTITRGTGVLPPPEEPPKSNFFSFIFGYLSKYTYFRKQITEDTYEEYRVFNIAANNYVTSGKWAKSGGDNGDMLLPVDFSLLDKLKGFKEKERFLYNCMYIEFLTLVIKKVKWYQRGIFKLVIFAISVAITVFTGGAGVSVAAVLTAAATSLAIGVAIDIAIKILLKFLSPELVKILAIAIIAAGLVAGNTSALKGLQNVSTKAFTILTMKADMLVKFGTKLVSAANNKQMDEIRESFLKESEKYKSKMEALDEYRLANTKYSPNTNSTYLDEDIRYAPAMIGETIDAMISRSLNSNPALVAINYVHGYVDFILELPTVAETTYKPITDV